ncbi:hypothetical protein ACM26V_24480 [Salipaludibacillus sp. HK11]|uniref:hypothetical protein n=1 Tax=Salipaludibacillus sp. HK11 TaxID=3394320 RepID=UPI0039FD3CD4
MASKDTFRGTAAGLFLAGALLASIYYLQPETLAFESDLEENQEDGRGISSLEEQGYIILTEDEQSNEQARKEELISENKTLELQIAELKQSIDDHEELDTSESSSESEESEDTYYSILSVEQGMTSKDISNRLVTLNIIESARPFEQELSDKGLENRIQIGEYTLNNKMSIEEIITMITS